MPTVSTTSLNIQKLQSFLRKESLDACLLLTADPHLSEHTPADFYWPTWLSNFTGSTAKMVVTQTQALLWVDSRYWLQAELELKDSGITLMRAGDKGIPSPIEWIVTQLPTKSMIAIDPQSVSCHLLTEFTEQLQTNDCSVVPLDVISQIWTDRPNAPHSNVFPLTRAQYSRLEKLSQIRKSLTSIQATSLVVTRLDEIAWCLNLRGNDAPCTPIFRSYLWIDQQTATLFIDQTRVPTDIAQSLASDGIKIAPYARAYETIHSFARGQSVCLDTRSVNAKLYSELSSDSTITLIDQISPIAVAKSKKTPAEIAAIEETMIEDGVALCELFCWIDEQQAQEAPTITEWDVSVKLHELRAKSPNFLCDSFETIAATGPNSAMPHYHPTAQRFSRLIDDNLLMIDSGGQYTGGTTDITRTVLIGKSTPEMKRDYTAVLRGHIAVATTPFPNGALGHQVDTLARIPLWEIGADFGHSTGHGVGFCLDVHEGPARLSPSSDATPHSRIVPGLLLSNEPAIYRANQYGVRLENLVTPTPYHASVSSQISLCTMKTLSLCPFDHRLISTAMMTSKEILWVNQYHQRVRTLLIDQLSNKAKRWLERACEPI